MQWKEHITVPSRWSHFIRGFPLVLVLAVSWSRSSFACLRSNTVNTPSRHSLENEKKICILTACLKTLTSSNGFPCAVLRLWRQTKSEAPGCQEQLHAMRPCKWKTCCILLGMRSMRETIPVKVLITLGSHRIFHTGTQSQTWFQCPRIPKAHPILQPQCTLCQSLLNAPFLCVLHQGSWCTRFYHIHWVQLYIPEKKRLVNLSFL